MSILALDLNGVLQENIVVETYLLTPNSNTELCQVITPLSGLFHTRLKRPIVEHNGIVLTYGDDYEFVYQSRHLKHTYGIVGHGAIAVINPTLTGELVITTNQLGGPYQEYNPSLLPTFIQKAILAPVNNVFWDDVTEAPYTAHPESKPTPAGSLKTGFNSITSLLWEINKTIRETSDSPEEKLTLETKVQRLLNSVPLNDVNLTTLNKQSVVDATALQQDVFTVDGEIVTFYLKNQALGDKYSLNEDGTLNELLDKGYTLANDTTKSIYPIVGTGKHYLLNSSPEAVTITDNKTRLGINHPVAKIETVSNVVAIDELKFGGVPSLSLGSETNSGAVIYGTTGVAKVLRSPLPKVNGNFGKAIAAAGSVLVVTDKSGIYVYSVFGEDKVEYRSYHDVPHPIDSMYLMNNMLFTVHSSGGREVTIVIYAIGLYGIIKENTRFSISDEVDRLIPNDVTIVATNDTLYLNLVFIDKPNELKTFSLDYLDKLKADETFVVDLDNKLTTLLADVLKLKNEVSTNTNDIAILESRLTNLDATSGPIVFNKVPNHPNNPSPFLTKVGEVFTIEQRVFLITTDVTSFVYEFNVEENVFIPRNSVNLELVGKSITVFEDQVIVGGTLGGSNTPVVSVYKATVVNDVVSLTLFKQHVDPVNDKTKTTPRVIIKDDLLYLGADKLYSFKFINGDLMDKKVLFNNPIDGGLTNYLSLDILGDSVVTLNKPYMEFYKSLSTKQSFRVNLPEEYKTGVSNITYIMEDKNTMLVFLKVVEEEEYVLLRYRMVMDAKGSPSLASYPISVKTLPTLFKPMCVTKQRNVTFVIGAYHEETTPTGSKPLNTLGAFALPMLGSDGDGTGDDLDAQKDIKAIQHQMDLVSITTPRGIGKLVSYNGAYLAVVKNTSQNDTLIVITQEDEFEEEKVRIISTNFTDVELFNYKTGEFLLKAEGKLYRSKITDSGLVIETISLVNKDNSILNGNVFDNVVYNGGNFAVFNSKVSGQTKSYLVDVNTNVIVLALNNNVVSLNNTFLEIYGFSYIITENGTTYQNELSTGKGVIEVEGLPRRVGDRLIQLDSKFYYLTTDDISGEGKQSVVVKYELGLVNSKTGVSLNGEILRFKVLTKSLLLKTEYGTNVTVELNYLNSRLFITVNGTGPLVRFITPIITSLEIQKLIEDLGYELLNLVKSSDTSSENFSEELRVIKARIKVLEDNLEEVTEALGNLTTKVNKQGDAIENLKENKADKTDLNESNKAIGLLNSYIRVEGTTLILSIP